MEALRKNTLSLPLAAIIVAALPLLFSCGGDDTYTPKPYNPGKKPTPTDTIPTPVDTSHTPVGRMYSNPVWKLETGGGDSSADPCIIKVGEWFYSYSTGSNIRIIKSRNLVDWEQVGTVFTNSTRPHWITSNGSDVGLWAPDCEFIDGRYVLYYGMSGSRKVGGVSQEWTGFGAATSPSPEGPFTDKGLVVSNDITHTTGNVDQFYFRDPVTGIQYMGWGSYGGNTGGIHIAELSDDGLSLKYSTDPAHYPISRIAGSAWEGGQMYYHKGVYYFFGSGGYCCSGENSDYNVQVAKSLSPLGPFKNKKGEDLNKTAGTWKIMASNDFFAGPGHVGEIITDDNGQEWIIYHSYVKGSASKYGRTLCLDRLTWDSDEYPVINDGKGPSSSSAAPIFK